MSNLRKQPLVALLMTTIAALAAVVSKAHAATGDYTVIVCANPDTGRGVVTADKVTPPGFTNHSDLPLGSADDSIDCGPTPMTSGRGVLLHAGVEFSTRTPGEGVGAFSFHSPAGVALERVELFWHGNTISPDKRLSYSIHSGPWDAVFAMPRGALCEWAASCVETGTATSPWATANRVVLDTPLEDGFGVTLACTIPDSSWTCTATKDVFVRVFGGKLALRDETNPQISGSASGALMTEGVVRGQQDLTVNATDSGSGVYRVQLLVDNAPALSRIVDSNAGKCADVNPANSDPYEFAHPVPCRLSAGGTYSFDTTQLPEGTHNLKILLEDAAGNSATLSNRNVVVDNVPDPAAGGTGRDGEGSGAGASTTVINTTNTTTGGTSGAGAPLDRGTPNGVNASDDARLTAYWANNRGTVLRSRYGRRHVIRGRLVDGKGRGIANARIELAATPAVRGATTSLDKGGARTRADGGWTLILPADVSSRMLSLRYRSHANDVTPAASRVLRLKVQAGIQLSITPRSASRGKTIRLRGRLMGRLVPRAGKVLELQARTPGAGWVTFGSVRTDRRGRFASRYTFRRGGPVTYEMRVRSRASGDYPFDTGASRALRVRVR
jgi:hypothetical protein